jgi:Ca-activated chloride channel family protein
LVLYQTEFRKPSFTVYCLDFSGSMEGDGEDELTGAMEVLLDPDLAARYFLQPSPEDVTVVLPFDDDIDDEWRVEGNDPAELRALFKRVGSEDASGGTAIYDCVTEALDILGSANLTGYAPAIILMTDGNSTSGSLQDVRDRWAQGPPGIVPVYGILFGNASDDEIDGIAEASSGRVFDGKSDLIGAMRAAKGNN